MITKIYYTNQELKYLYLKKISIWENGYQESFYGKFKWELGRLIYQVGLGRVLWRS